MTSATIFEAKTNLSELIKKAQAGDEVVITSGRDKTPVAVLTPLKPFKPKRLGVCYNPDFVLPSDFFDPPSEADLNDWESGVV
jgi:prevent-host-death family protein